MNDRFKFRVWNFRGEMLFIRDIFFYDSNHECQGITDMDGNEHSVNGQVELMQSTGLKDKNGKVIYEGDIVKWWVNGNDPVIAPVEYFNDACCYWMAQAVNRDYGDVLNDWLRGEYEVIGNIYENPELLEGEE